MKAVGDIQQRCLTQGVRKAIPYTLQRKKGKKNVTLRVTPDGLIKVSAPYFCTIAFIEDVIRNKQEWIWRSQERLASTSHPPVHVSWEDGGTFYLYGNLYTLTICEGLSSRPDIRLIPEEKRLVVSLRPEDRAGKLEHIIKEFFRKAALATYIHDVQQMLERTGIGREGIQVRITSSRSRWGSCSSLGTICFSLRSIVLPHDLREYLVLHETAHLVHMDHGIGFKQLLGTYMPDWKKREKEMQGWHGASLAYAQLGIAPDKL